MITTDKDFAHFNSPWMWLVWRDVRQYGYRWTVQKRIPPLPFLDAGQLLDIDNDGCFDEIEAVVCNIPEKTVYIELEQCEAPDHAGLWVLDWINSGWHVEGKPTPC